VWTCLGGLLLAATLTGGGLVALLAHAGPLAPDRSVPPTPAAPASLPTVPEPGPRDSGPGNTTSPWAHISDEAHTKADYFARLNDPANSDLAPDLARELAALASRFLEADVTGEGRTVFGDYWGGTTEGACCRGVVILAAGAERHLGRSDVADVAVIWSAQRLDGGTVSEQTTVVFFARRGGSWQPIHPWEAA
jgi:hypothetical protein